MTPKNKFILDRLNKIFSVSLVAAPLFFCSQASAASYEIDPTHTNVGFSVRHLMVSNVKGAFSEVTGVVDYDPKNIPATKISAEIGVKSVDTRLEKRDEHLRGPDFLNAEKHPLMKFSSSSVESAGEGKLKVTGDLTLNGTTKPVTLNVVDITQEVTDPWGNSKIGASASTKISRKDFGLTWNKALETGGVVVGDEVSIVIDLELTKKK